MRSNWFLGCAICSILIGGSSVANANLVTDPSFELNSPSWVFTGSSGITGNAHTGSRSGYVNCIPCGLPGYSGAINQTIDTTIGDSYSVSFWLAENESVAFGTSGNLSVAFGNTVGFLTTTPSTPNTYGQYTFTATATSLTTNFTFASQALVGGTFFIDDVSVTDVGAGGAGVPEPATLFTTAGVFLFAVFLRKRRAALHT